MFSLSGSFDIAGAGPLKGVSLMTFLQGLENCAEALSDSKHPHKNRVEALLNDQVYAQFMAIVNDRGGLGLASLDKREFDAVIRALDKPHRDIQSSIDTNSYINRISDVFTGVVLHEQGRVGEYVSVTAATLDAPKSKHAFYIRAYEFLARLYTLETLKHPDTHLRVFHEIEVDAARARFMKVATLDQLPHAAEAVRLPLNGAMTYKPVFFN